MAGEGHLHPQLPPGFRFHPTDEELVVHYLEKKASRAPLPVAIIAEIDLYKFDPWELPEKASFGGEQQQEWYFFSPRERKYPNGARPNRAATSGYWKATGTDKTILASNSGGRKVGVKKALVFYGGKPPRGVKTNWIMHEYRLAGDSLRMDDWVLCRIYQKHCKAPMDGGGGEESLLKLKRTFNHPPRFVDCETSFIEGLLMAGDQGSHSMTALLEQIPHQYNRATILPEMGQPQHFPGSRWSH